MKFIEAYIDNLLDCFPLNKITRKMRMDLLLASSEDYEKLCSQGEDEKTASQKIIQNIQPAEKLAKMIPNDHEWSYYILLSIGAILMLIVLFQITRPDFLQIFLPARFQFPDIIERYIQYICSGLVCFVLTMNFYRRLPQTLLDYPKKYAVKLLYGGTVMAALYLAIALAFIWFSFNGLVDSEFTHDPVLFIMNAFYQIFILPWPMTVLYACVNTWCFIACMPAYHLDKYPEPYDFKQIYQTLPLEESTSGITVQKEKQLEKPQTQLVPVLSNPIFIDIEPIIDLVTDTVSFYQEQPISEIKTETTVQVKKPIKKKRRSKNKLGNVRLANDVKERQRNH